MIGFKKNPASFRDIDGFIFECEGSIYRAVNECYMAAYTKVISSGLYEKLVKEELLIPHVEEKGFPLTIPNHHEIAKGTLRAILRQAGIAPQEFLDLQ